MAAKLVKTKKKCCKDNPRCSKCPVVWKRLETAELAEREGPRFYRASPALKKKQLKAARKRRVAALA
jgi:hypothetical protein